MILAGILEKFGRKCLSTELFAQFEGGEQGVLPIKLLHPLCRWDPEPDRLDFPKVTEEHLSPGPQLNALTR